MSTSTVSTPPTEIDIFRRIVDAEQTALSAEAAKSLLELRFSPRDQRRMDHLAEKNRSGRLSAMEEQELESFIRAGQLLGILQSKARQSLKTRDQGDKGNQ